MFGLSSQVFSILNERIGLSVRVSAIGVASVGAGLLASLLRLSYALPLSRGSALHQVYGPDGKGHGVLAIAKLKS